VGEVYCEDGGWGAGGRDRFCFPTHRAIRPAQDGAPGIWAVFEEGQSHVAGAAAEVEDAGFGALEGRAEGAGGAGPHPAVEASGEDVVGEVIGWGDGIEHLLDVLCSGLLVGNADGAGSGGEFVFRLWCDGHEFYVKRWRASCRKFCRCGQ
jgi:hypothetical protein